MSVLRGALAVLGKELRAELRTRELVTTTLVFAVMVVVLFSFAFDPTVEDARRYGPGLLWLALLFAGSLMLHPSFARELANDTLDALRLAPVPAFALFLGKALANFVFLAVTEALLVPVFAVLYNVPVLGVLPQLVLVLALGTLGLVVVGTAFSAIAAQARMRELLLPLLLLPLLVPVLLAAVEATAALLAAAPRLLAAPVQLLAGFNVVYLAATYLLCEYLVEE